jgi:putative flippase GtrA
MEASELARFEARARAMLSHPVAGEFARYFTAGLVALGVDFTLYVAFTELAGWHYLASATVSFLAGLSTVYLFSILWVFRERQIRRNSHEFLLFAAIGLVGLALTAVVLYIFTDIFGIDYRLSKIAAAALVFMFNFGCRKFFLFRAPRHRSTTRDPAGL